MEPQTLHLVLREPSDGHTSSTPSPFPTTNPTSAPAPPAPLAQQSTGHAAGNSAGIQGLPHQQHQHQHYTPPLQPQPQVRFGVPHYHNVTFGIPQGPIQTFPVAGHPMNPPPSLTPQQYSQWMRAMSAHAGAHSQAARAGTPGTPGMPDMPTTNIRGPLGARTPSRTTSPFQPDGTRTTVRESNGPGGLQWRITLNETFVNNPLQRPMRTGSPFPATDTANTSSSQPRSVPNGGQFSSNELQNVLRAADAGSATRAMTDAMRRNASSSSLANLGTGAAHHPIPPGVTTPLIPSRAGSGTATPDPLRAFGTRNQSTTQSQVQSQGTPEVYILSSPTGPRALLLNSSLEAYFSPPARIMNQPIGYPFLSRPFPPTLVNPFNQQFVTPTPTTQPQTSSIGRSHASNAQPNNAPQQQPQPRQPQAPAQLNLPQAPRVQPHLGHAMARADNPQVQAIRLAQIWPHIWMVIRLGLFIWFFTSPTSSWSRWVTVITIAITLFLVNTGLLNPLAEQFWIPFRRHLENLIPLADGQRQIVQPAARADHGNAVAGAGHEDRMDPANAAARLVQQRRRANTNWLMDQARRLERAGILFLASIAPGVAERHIAQVEAEARAERRRREAEAAAAAAAAEAGAEQSEEQSPDSHDSATVGGESERQEEAAGDEHGNERPPAAEEPLVVI